MFSHVNRLGWHWIILIIFGVAGLLNGLIANDQPLAGRWNGKWYFPAFQDVAADWGLMQPSLAGIHRDYDFYLPAPIPYKATTIISEDASMQPMGRGKSGIHLLGTDLLGRDVAAGVIRGCFTSFRIGLLATFICAVLGILIGMAMGYFGNHILLLNAFQWSWLLFVLLTTLFYTVYPPSGWEEWRLVMVLSAVVISAVGLHIFSKSGRASLKVPLDSWMMRLITLRRSLPTLILLLVLFPLFERPAVSNVILVICLLGWTSFARHARAETMSIKERSYVTAARIMGSNHWSILRRHIFPNILHTLLLLAAMTFATNILLESTLSFLGMGLPPDEVSWGSLLSEGRKNYHAWWLVIFPGIALFILVYTINSLADQYLEKDA